MNRQHDLNRRRMRAAKATWKRLTGRDRSMEEWLQYLHEDRGFTGIRRAAPAPGGWGPTP